MTNERPLTEEEVFKIPEQPGVFVLYAGGLPILVEAEEGSLRKRLLRCREQYPDATDFSIEGLQEYYGGCPLIRRK
jgi:hypothetical protein